MGNEVSSTAAKAVQGKKGPSPAAASAPQRSKPKPPAKKTLHETLSFPERPKDRRLEDYYEIIKLLAKGSSCDIFTVRRKGESEESSTIYALKVIPKSGVDTTFLEEMKNEVGILKRLDHPNIVRIYDLFETDTNVSLVMEFCSGGTLLKRAPYSEQQAAVLLSKILSAVAFMHKNKVVHRDLKPDNVVFANESPEAEPKVIDFGLSKPYVETTPGANSQNYRMHCRVGTLQTMSPQVLKGNYTAKADVWAVGVIAHILLSGKAPFEGGSTKEIATKIVREDYDKELTGEDWKMISSQAKAFVRSLMEYEPEKRKTAAAALRSAWLQKHHPPLAHGSDENIIKDIQSAILGINNQPKLKKMVNMIIAHNSSNESLMDLRTAFEAMDKNRQGTINLFEFKTAMKAYGCSDDQLRNVFKEIDANNTGVINFTEFLAAALEARVEIEDSLIQQAFQQIDVDGSGFVSRENLCTVMGETCSNGNCDALVDELLEDADSNHDGKISYEEFLALYRTKQLSEGREEVLNATGKGGCPGKTCC